jgi:hypothetical protein
MSNLKKLISSLEEIKKRIPMYFSNDPEPVDLFTFLMGWDMASDTKYCRELIDYISKSKKLGSRIPSKEDISFSELLDSIINYLIKL